MKARSPKCVVRSPERGARNAECEVAELAALSSSLRTPHSTLRTPSLPALLLGLLIIALLPGCVHRRLTVNSNPPGAKVVLDGEEVGETPTSVDFTHYGTREIVLQKDGYDTLKTMQTVAPPWYQVPPIDFFSDNLLPFQLTNRHEFSYQLQPSPTVPSTQGLRDRANSLRSEAHAGP